MTPRRLAIIASHPIQYQAPLFRELAQSVDLTVFFAHKATPAQQAAAGFGVAFDWDTDLRSGYPSEFLKNVARDPSAARFGGCDTPEVGARLRRGGFDAVLVLGWHLRSFWQAAVAARAAGVSVIVRGDSQLTTPRNWPLRVAKHLLYPPMLRVFSAALYVGQRSRAYFEAYGFPSERLYFAPHAADDGWFRERASTEARTALRRRLGVGDGEKLLLFAGKLVEFKRPLDVVRGAAALRTGGVAASVIVAGDGPLAGAMRWEADKLGVPLHMLGFLNQGEIPSAYAASDLLVLPSNGRETWGLVANEALACGTPIAVSEEAGCAPDLAADGAAGRTFRTGDIDHLAEIVRGILAAPPTREAITSKRAKYSVGATIDGIVSAIEFCIT